MPDLTNKITLVTGSTKGIGKAIAEAFIDKGSRVIIHGRNRAEIEKVRASIGAFACVDGDLGTSEGCDSVVEQLASLGQVEVLVNNAGIFGVEDFFEIADEEWLRYFQVNVMSTVRLCKALMPSMLANDYGRIINVSSEAAIKPLPQMIHYSMTKTSLVSLSRGLAELTKGTGVTVNSVLPGPTWTEGVSLAAASPIRPSAIAAAPRSFFSWPLSLRIPDRTGTLWRSPIMPSATAWAPRAIRSPFISTRSVRSRAACAVPGPWVVSSGGRAPAF